MSARWSLALRGLIWDVVWRLGTPAVALPLLGLAAAQLAVTAGLGAWGSREAAGAFAGSWASWAIAFALLADALAAIFRTLPFEAGREGRLRMTRVDAAAGAALLLAGGYALAALAFTASLASRERIEFRVAVGEEFTGGFEQALSRDPPRPLSPGPFAARFTVEEVRGGVAAGRAGAPDAIGAAFPDARVRTATPVRPLWFGWGRFVRAVGSGHVFRYELAGGDGAVLESAFAKLELEPPGTTDSFRLDAFPYRVYLRLAPAAGARSGGAPLAVEVYRGKLRVAGGVVAPGDRLAVDGMSLGFPEWRPWVQLEMLRDPGIPILTIGATLAACGLLLRAVGRRRPAAAPRLD